MPKKHRTIDWPATLLRACRKLEAAGGAPTLATLASAVGVSPSELNRQFRARLGCTPRAYRQAIALHRLAGGMARAPGTLQALLEAGFESPSVAYVHAGRALGVPPGRLRGDIAIDWWMGLSALGWMLMAATPRGICWLAFGERPGELHGALRAAFPRARLQPGELRLRSWFESVRGFLLLPRAALALPLDVQGTAFQARIWAALQRVPLGSTVGYAELARRAGRPRAVRAAASACAANRVALVVPCHRAVRSDGGLGGYRWGLGRKARLLAAERAMGQSPPSHE